jgi:hypothetical protein
MTKRIVAGLLVLGSVAVVAADRHRLLIHRIGPSETSLRPG